MQWGMVARLTVEGGFWPGEWWWWSRELRFPSRLERNLLTPLIVNFLFETSIQWRLREASMLLGSEMEEDFDHIIICKKAETESVAPIRQYAGGDSWSG